RPDGRPLGPPLPVARVEEARARRGDPRAGVPRPGGRGAHRGPARQPDRAQGDRRRGPRAQELHAAVELGRGRGVPSQVPGPEGGRRLPRRDERHRVHRDGRRPPPGLDRSYVARRRQGHLLLHRPLPSCRAAGTSERNSFADSPRQRHQECAVLLQGRGAQMIRGWAVLALLLLPQDGIEPLARELESPELPKVYLAVAGLSALGEKAIPQLEARAKDAKGRVRDYLQLAADEIRASSLLTGIPAPKRITMKSADRNVIELLGELRTKTGLAIALENLLGEEKMPEIPVEFRDATALEAFDAICK